MLWFKGDFGLGVFFERFFAVEGVIDSSAMDAFAIWAFGEKYDQYETASAFLQHWNDLHGDLLRLKPDGIICEDAEKIVKVYRDYIADVPRVQTV